MPAIFPRTELDPAAAIALAAHSADTTAVHGIADTAQLLRSFLGDVRPMVLPGAYAHIEDITPILKYAKARGFTTVTASDIIDAIDGVVALPAKPLFLSADDEATQWLSVIDPVLATYGATITGFVSTGYPDGEVMTSGTDPFFYTNTSPLTWDQLRTLKATGRWDFHNHTRTHPAMATLSTAQREAEMSYAQARLLTELGVVPRAFCHPRDSVNLASIQEAFSFGFRMVTIGPQAVSSFAALFGPADRLAPNLLVNRTRNQLLLWRADPGLLAALENVWEPVGNRIPDMPLDDNALGVWTVSGGTEGSGSFGVRFDQPDKSATIDLRTTGGTVTTTLGQFIAMKPGETVWFAYVRQYGVGAGAYTVKVKEYGPGRVFLRDVTIESLTGTAGNGTKEVAYKAPDDCWYVKIELQVTGAPSGSYATFAFPFFGGLR